MLAGCSLVFSKVIPLDMAHPERHALWQRALQVCQPTHELCITIIQ